jgi:hypothetical protein
VLSLLVVLGLFVLLLSSARSPASQLGGRWLGRIGAMLLGIVALISIALASDRLGNRLSPVEGYWPVAGRIFLTLGMTIGAPLMLSAVAIRAASRAGGSTIVIAGAGFFTALVGWFVGLICMFAFVWS